MTGIGEYVYLCSPNKVRSIFKNRETTNLCKLGEMPLQQDKRQRKTNMKTKLTRKKIILLAVTAVVLAAIAFIVVPSLLPANYDKMRRSVTLIECREYYEITRSGKVVAVCNDITNDTTLDIVKEQVDSDTERKAMVCGCWINRWTFMPSCGGRILTVDPFYGEKDMLAAANANIGATIEKTLAKARETVKKERKKQDELEYYLNTHSVKDEGYNTMADYAENNRKNRERLERGIEILERLKDGKGLRIRKNRYYTLLYPTTKNKTGKISCQEIARETNKGAKGTMVLKTCDGFMPEDACSIYQIKRYFVLIPEKGDSITAAGIFGLNNGCSEKAATQKPNVFRGRATSTETHDIPELLAPEGAPLFNRNGYFIGINHNGGIMR